MNVLFVTKGFPTESDPMTGNYEATQAMAIAAKGHHVTVLAVRWRSILHVFNYGVKHKKCGDIDIYERDGVVPVIPHLFNNYRLNRWMMKRSFRSFFQYYLKRYSIPDIVHIHSLFVANYSIITKEEFGFPTVLTEHWSGLNAGEIDENLASEKHVYQNADQVIVVSNALRSAIKKYYGIDSLVINNMVDNRFFEKQRQAKEDRVFTFVTVGRLVPIKHFGLLVEAFSQIKHKNVRLVIVGEGQEYNGIKKRIEEFGLQRKVEMVGLKKPEEVADILCESDCFVLSSHRETFGIVLIEAMAKGLPVISTKCGGPEDFVNDGNGLLVEPDNSSALAEAMDYMIEHACEFDSQKIRYFCYDNFSQDKIADQIIEVYRQVLKHN